MSHSVRTHLRLDLDDYDRTIRRFIPGYEAMLRIATSAVAAIRPDRVLDLGAGTGALAEELLRRDPEVTVELWDIDPEMLERARTRVASFGDRGQVLERSYFDALPECDGVMASLSLHHIPRMEDKAELYTRIHGALRPGGVFANADAVLPPDPVEQERTFEAWADHMVGQGIDRDRAFQHFEEWSQEDTYQTVDDELRALGDAGFETDIAFREAASTVIVARKPSQRGGA